MSITMTMSEERCTPISILSGYSQEQVCLPSPKRFRVSLAAALGMIVDRPTLTCVGAAAGSKLSGPTSRPFSAGVKLQAAAASCSSATDDEENGSVSSNYPYYVLRDAQSPASPESSRAASYEQQPFDALSRASTAVTCSSPCSSKVNDDFDQPAHNPAQQKLVSVCTSWTEQKFHEALSFTSSNGYEE